MWYKTRKIYCFLKKKILTNIFIYFFLKWLHKNYKIKIKYIGLWFHSWKSVKKKYKIKIKQTTNLSKLQLLFYYLLNGLVVYLGSLLFVFDL